MQCGRVLVCIPFWEPPHPDVRIAVLKKCIDEYRRIPNSHIVVHTQSQNAKVILESMGVECIVSSGLVHPFALTYEHRKLFQQRISDFDYFWYAEDDLLVRPETLEWYFETLQSLWPTGCPAVVRTERNSSGVLVNTDNWYVTRIKPDDILRTNGRTYVTLDNQYHACYGITRRILEQYASQPLYHEMVAWNQSMRENAASFLIWTCKIPGYIEMVDSQISDKCLVPHLTNNYADGPLKFGKIPIDELVSLET